ncbi:rhomboid family intramembrane serine protease [Chitinophaga lutea]
MIGFPPRYNTFCSLRHRSPAERRAIAWLAFREAGWRPSQSTPDSIVAFTPFSLRSWNERVSVTLKEDGLELSSYSTGMQVFDLGRNRGNIRRLRQSVQLLGATATREQLDAMLANEGNEVRTTFMTGAIETPAAIQAGGGGCTADAEEARAAAQSPSNNPAQRSRKYSFSAGSVPGLAGMLRPVKGYFVTPILILLQILIFLLLTNKWLFPSSSWWAADPVLLETAGANLKPLTLSGEPWRLVTAGLLHADLLHLFFNVYGLMIGGICLEPLLGRWRFLAVYVACSLAAAMGSLWWHDITPSVGASGAVLGLLGCILALLLRGWTEPAERRALLMSIGIYLAFTLSGIFYDNNYDHGAHVAGLLMGFLIGWLLSPGLRAGRSRAAPFVVTGVALLALFALIPRDVHTYIRKLKEMDRNFNLSYNVYESGTEAEKIRWLQDYSMFYMDENLRIMDEIDHLRLGADARKRNALLRKLVLRQKEVFNYNLLTLREGGNRYDPAILDALRDLKAMQQELISQ